MNKNKGQAALLGEVRNREADYVVLVDRNILPSSYPRDKYELRHRELETNGPVKFDIRTLQFWSLPNQSSWTGYNLLDFLEVHSLLVDFLGLRDLEEIERKGPDFFTTHFYGLELVGWKSVIVKFSNGNSQLLVPMLSDNKGTLVQNWRSLNMNWHERFIGLSYK